MAAKLVWIRDDGSLSCGHPPVYTNGRPGEYEGEYWCEMCALHVAAKLEQGTATAVEAVQARDEGVGIARPPRQEEPMSEGQIDAQMDRETAIAGLENAARRYAATFLAIAAGEADQAGLQAARQRLAAAACAYVAAGGQPWADANPTQE